MKKDISYYRKINNIEYQDSNKSDISDIQEVIFGDLKENLYCKDVIISHIEDDEIYTYGLVYDSTNKLLNTTTKFFIPEPTNVYCVGSLIKCEDDQYVIMDKEFVSDIYWRYTLMPVQYTLHIYKDKKLYDIPCFISNGKKNVIGLKDNSYVLLPNGSYYAYIPDWNIIKKSDIGIRFLIKGCAYKVEGIDIISKDGMCYLSIKEDIISSDDNVELDIANYYNNQDIEDNKNDSDNDEDLTNDFVISFDKDTTTLKLGRTLSLNAIVSLNGNISNEEIEYVVQELDFITYVINDNKISITSINSSKNIGKSFVIKCSLKNYPTIFVERQISIVSLV